MCNKKTKFNSQYVSYLKLYPEGPHNLFRILKVCLLVASLRKKEDYRKISYWFNHVFPKMWVSKVPSDGYWIYCCGSARSMDMWNHTFYSTHYYTNTRTVLTELKTVSFVVVRLWTEISINLVSFVNVIMKFRFGWHFWLIWVIISV